MIDLLKEKDLKLSLAESLTGGMIAQRIVNVSGASEVFGYGFVTYSNKAKHKMPGSEETYSEGAGCSFCQMCQRNGKGCLQSIRSRYQYFRDRFSRTGRWNKGNSGWNCIYGLLL